MLNSTQSVNQSLTMVTLAVMAVAVVEIIAVGMLVVEVVGQWEWWW